MSVGNLRHFDTRSRKLYHARPIGRRGRTQVLASSKLDLTYMWDLCREKVTNELRWLLGVRSGELGSACQRCQTPLQKQGRSFEEGPLIWWPLWPQSDSQRPSSGVEKRVAEGTGKLLDQPALGTWMTSAVFTLLMSNVYKCLVLGKPQFAFLELECSP